MVHPTVFLFIRIGDRLVSQRCDLPLTPASVNSERPQLLSAMSSSLIRDGSDSGFQLAGPAGKCRYCHAPISPRYPLIESLTGILYALCGFYYGATLTAVLHCLFLSILIVMAMIDLDTMEIPDRLSVFILILAVIALALEPSSIPSRILGALIISVPFWILSRLNAMGGGDVKIMCAAGFYLGAPLVLTAFVLSSFIGAIAALYLMICKKKDRKSEIPFGPFLAIGLTLSVLWGNALIQAYLALF